MSVTTNRQNQNNSADTNRSVTVETGSSLWNKGKGEIWGDESYMPWQDEGVDVVQPSVNSNREVETNNANTNRQ